MEKEMNTVDSIEKTVDELKSKIDEIEKSGDEQQSKSSSNFVIPFNMDKNSREKIETIRSKTLKALNHALEQCKEALDDIQNNEKVKETLRNVKDGALRTYDEACVAIQEIKNSDKLKETIGMLKNLLTKLVKR